MIINSFYLILSQHAKSITSNVASHVEAIQLLFVQFSPTTDGYNFKIQLDLQLDRWNIDIPTCLTHSNQSDTP